MVELTTEQLLKLIEESKFYRDDKLVYTGLCEYLDRSQDQGIKKVQVIRTDLPNYEFVIVPNINIDKAFYDNGILYVVCKRSGFKCRKVEEFKHENVIKNHPAIPEYIIAEIVKEDEDVVFKEIKW